LQPQKSPKTITFTQLLE